jgi:triosephosphate isomerase (TIM)
MRRLIIAGNWKMNKTGAEGAALVAELQSAAGARPDVDVVVCPPFTALAAVRDTTGGGPVGLGAQNLFWRDSGAYTGEVSGPMLRDAGCDYVIIGHSERRGRFGVPEKNTPDEALSVFGDSDAAVSLKTQAAFRHGLTPIVCCGETLDERRAGQTDAIVAGQLERGLAGISAGDAARLVVAYEPVWAIGTGEVCAADEANRVCGVVRATLGRLFGAETAAAIRVQYGGSVKPDNAAELLGQAEIDGALVGGASLKASDFAAIVAAAPRR